MQNGLNKYGVNFLKSMFALLAMTLIFGSQFAMANQKQAYVLFHPTDPTLEKIAEILGNAKTNIDIAMYNMDVTQESPVIRLLSSDSMQKKIRSGKLAIRVIYEGYGSASDVAAKCNALESLGLDVRTLRGGKKVHHKFAVIDSHSDQSTVISGSANWSLSSRNNYDENITFWNGYSELAQSFQKEFNILWERTEPFGVDLHSAAFPSMSAESLDEGVSVSFNTSNYELTPNGLRRDPRLQGWTLTRSIVNAIDKAESSIKISTTRIVLRPIYDALLRAASRGVKISVVVNQDEYAAKSDRRRWQLNTCDDIFDDSCSTNQAFPWFLDQEESPIKENISVRIKFFSMNLGVTLAKQMHSKYLIIDDQTVLTGSFNWSVSAEWEHIENIIEIFGENEKSMVQDYINNHELVFTQGREQHLRLIEAVKKASATGEKIDCNLIPAALTYREIDNFLTLPAKLGTSFKKICR